MTASGVQSTIGRGRRIIERPRLIKLLDETDARTILLLAPAGYGKTTLARQWLKSMSRCITLSLTPSDRDVLWFAEEVAREIQSLDQGAARLVREHILARPSPERAPATLARAIAEALKSARAHCIFLDNYEVITESPECEDLVARLGAVAETHLLVASRVRPSWASSRQTIYGDVCEVARLDLAMTEDEVRKVVGRSTTAARIASRAQGWAAVVGLAANVDSNVDPPMGLPQRLHRYLAEELLSRVPSELREDLFAQALSGSGQASAQKPKAEPVADRLAALDALGFGTGLEPFELHPLIEDFLLEKLIEEPDSPKRIRQAIQDCLRDQKWERAISLVTRFKVHDMADTTLRAAFRPLVRTGRLTSLAALAASMVDPDAGLPLPAAEVVHAEVAFRKGQIELAQELAERAEAELGQDDALASHAAAIQAQCLHFKAELGAANVAFQRAYDRAQDARDRSEARNGITFTTIFNEQPGAREALAAVRQTRNSSAVSFLRYATADVAYRILGGPGLAQPLALDAIRRAWAECEDPRARSAAAHNVAYLVAIAADYESADSWMQLFYEDIQRFDLEFAIPLAHWANGRIALGRRRYGEVRRALNAIEDEVIRTRDHRHEINAATLRARLSLLTGDIDAALSQLSLDTRLPLIPSWRGEFLATRALALALSGDTKNSLRVADAADAASISHDSRLFAQVGRVITDAENTQARRALIEAARQYNVWDPVLFGARASAMLATALCEDPETRPSMESLYQIAQDLPLARRAGFRTRATSSTTELLTPRELEVLGLIAQGCKNGEISRTLFISDSTTKVHVRHILEKLGARSRAEAAARYEKELTEASMRSRHEDPAEIPDPAPRA
jgi:LuxR family maltose regulon positive regulatory protein